MVEEKKEVSDVIITNADLKELTEKLTSLIGRGWVTEISKRISETPEWKAWSNDPLTADNTIHIAKGVIKGQRHRALFAREGWKMINEQREIIKGVENEMAAAQQGNG